MYVTRYYLLSFLFGVAFARELFVGSMNIQTFGTTKASHPAVMKVLTQIATKYDKVFNLFPSNL